MYCRVADKEWVRRWWQKLNEVRANVHDEEKKVGLASLSMTSSSHLMNSSKKIDVWLKMKSLSFILKLEEFQGGNRFENDEVLKETAISCLT